MDASVEQDLDINTTLIIFTREGCLLCRDGYDTEVVADWNTILQVYVRLHPEVAKRLESE